MSMLEGKKLLITGVVNRESIAYEVARQAQEAGAEVVLTSFGRVRRMTERSASKLPQPPDVLELDVNSPEDLEAVAADLRERWGRVDGILHAIAFAPEDALGGNFLNTPVESAETAFRTSAFSFKALAVALADLFPEEGASIVGMDFDAQVAWPVYDWMGVAKAALEATSRYLARDLGPRGVRVNLISAGPLGTLAARGIPGFGDLATAWERQAPLGWDTDDVAPVASARPVPAQRHGARDHGRGAARRRRVPRDGHSPRPGARGGRRMKPPPVFLTGATGFLGMEVLARLLERGDRDVLALVRAPDREAAEARLEGVLGKLWRDPSPYRARVRAVAGDVTRPAWASTRPSAPTWPRRSARCCTARRRSPSTCRSTRRARSTSRARAR